MTARGFYAEPIGAVVTGVGPVSAIGSGRNAFWDALLAGTHGFGPITRCDASASPSKIAAEVKDFDLETYVEKGPVMARHTPRPVQLALAASVLALHDAELDLDACDPDRLGIHVGTSVGNLGEMFALKARAEKTGQLPPQAAFHAFNHSAACVLSSFFNIRGPVHTTTSGCNSGIDALGQSLRMIQAGAADAILVAGSDCELVPEVLLALNASKSLTTRYNDDPGRAIANSLPRNNSGGHRPPENEFDQRGFTAPAPDRRRSSRGPVSISRPASRRHAWTSRGPD